ncbi:MAG: hypothetical protein ACW97Z_12880 [Candidatus Hodarchaeales archaeon]|jgi:hypothetical protein
MQIVQFEEYLQNKDIKTDSINNSVRIIEEFDKFLKKSGKTIEKVEYCDLHNFSASLIQNGENTYENYGSLLQYGYFTKNNELIAASMELLDGREMIVNFSKILSEKYGEVVRNDIFEGIEIPPLGLHPKKKPTITKKLVKRFISKFGEKKSVRFFAIGLRDKYTESYKKPRERFLESNNIDLFLHQRRQKFYETLESHLRNKALFFTQEVTRESIDYVKNDPTIESGVREENRVIITKIPYMTVPYLNASTKKERRYYFCHNPWIREALLEEDKPINPIFCNCSGGYYKNYWEVVLNYQPLKVELLESVINGDEVCRFALHLPQEIVDLTHSPGVNSAKDNSKA